VSHNQVLHCLNGYRAVAYSLQLLIGMRENCAGNVSDTRSFARDKKSIDYLIFSEPSCDDEFARELAEGCTPDSEFCKL